MQSCGWCRPDAIPMLSLMSFADVIPDVIPMSFPIPSPCHSHVTLKPQNLIEKSYCRISWVFIQKFSHLKSKAVHNSSANKIKIILKINDVH